MRRSSVYTQLGIGDCGHVVVTWPQVADIGGRNPVVVCEQCMREKYGLSVDEQLLVWVALKETSVTPAVSKPKVKREKKPKPLTPWQTLLQQEGLF